LAKNFRVGRARRAEKIAIIFCGLKNRDMMAGCAKKSRIFVLQSADVLAADKVKNCLTRTKNPVYNLWLS